MREITVRYSVDPTGRYWVARGRPPILAPPWVDPPAGQVARFGDSASTFNGSKGFG